MQTQNLSSQEAAYRIEHIYHARYNPDLNLSIWEQLEICESLAETERNYTKKYVANNENVSVNGSVSDSSKQRVNFELKDNKQTVILRLKECNYKTPVFEVADLLEELFKDYKAKAGWWAIVAEKWNPRAINRVLARMTKLHGKEWITLQNPAAYFTSLIQHRKRRRSFIAIDDSCKQKSQYLKAIQPSLARTGS